MSVSSEVSRLTTLRNSIRTKLIALGILSDSSADLDDCDVGINGIVNRTSLDISQSQGTVTIPSGYYASSINYDAGANVRYYYTGSSDPTSDIGSDGDLYFKS